VKGANFWRANMATGLDSPTPQPKPVNAEERKGDTRLASTANLLHENPWFAVRNRDGFFTIEHHLTQVVVLPLVEGRAAVMVRVPRPVVKDVTLELPAGSAERHETPMEGAARELAEETGISVVPHRLVQMARLTVMPNRTPDLVYVFRVDLSQAEFDQRKPHDAEVSGVELVSIAEIGRLIACGAIYTVLPIAVLGMHVFASRNRSSI